MKKLLPLLSLILLLTACGGKPESSSNVSEDVSSGDNSGTGDTPIGGSSSYGGVSTIDDIVYSDYAIDMKTATEYYKADFEQCKAAGYQNLNFENTEVFPVEVVVKCRDLEVMPLNKRLEEIKRQMTEKEKVKKFKEYCEFFLGDYDEEWGGFDTLDADWDKRTSLEIDGFGYTIYEKLANHTKEIENEDFHINWLVYVDPYKKNYLWFTPSSMKYPYEYNNGEAAKILKESGKGCLGVQSGLSEDGWDMPVARYLNDGSNNDVTYRLADGDCSIGEAIEYFTKDFWEALPFAPEDKQPYLVRYIEVYPMTDDTFAYFIRFSPTFSVPIPFERGISMGGHNLPDEFSLESQALMIKKNDIDMARSIDPIYGMHKINGEITKIIPLKKAVDIVSEKVTRNVTFDVVEIDLVYHGNNSPDRDTATVLKPTWLIRLFNPNDNRYYNTYVDAVTGAFSIYNYNA